MLLPGGRLETQSLGGLVALCVVVCFSSTLEKRELEGKGRMPRLVDFEGKLCQFLEFDSC